MTRPGARYPTPAEAAEAIVEAGRILYDRGLVAATEGNISVRIGAERIVVTPTGACKGRLKSWDLVTVTPEGKKMGGRGLPSSELALHLAIYGAREETRAVVHAHPPTATGFAVAGVPLADCVLPEVVLTVGSIPIAPYGTPSTGELSERALPTARRHDAFLLKNHGAVTQGGDLWEALHRMEMMESFAKVVFTARTLGNVDPLAPEEVKKLLDLPGLPAPPASGCGNCSACTCGAALSAGSADKLDPKKKTPPDGDQAVIHEVLRKISRR